MTPIPYSFLSLNVITIAVGIGHINDIVVIGVVIQGSTRAHLYVIVVISIVLTGRVESDTSTSNTLVLVVDLKLQGGPIADHAQFVSDSVEYLAVFVGPYRYGIPFGKLGRFYNAHRLDGIVLAGRGSRSVRGNDVDLEILVGAREVLPEGCTNGVIRRDRVTLEKLEININGPI